MVCGSMVWICSSDLFFLPFFFCFCFFLLHCEEKKTTKKKIYMYIGATAKCFHILACAPVIEPPEDISCLTLYDVHALMYSIFQDIALYPSAFANRLAGRRGVGKEIPWFLVQLLHLRKKTTKKRQKNETKSCVVS